MRSTLERIRPDANSSFRLLLTPHLSDVFLWHYHPEYEIVYIEGASGTRHVGDHISRYQGSDLVFIGPNIPHLNFDYGVRTEYRKVVVQLNADFLGADLWQAPELAAIADLFSRARSGLSFYGETKAEVGRDLARLADLPPFDRLLLLLRVFQRLAGSAEVTRLHGEPVAGAYDLDEQRRLKRLTQFVAECYSRRIELREAAELVHLTEAAFCRSFKRMTRLTFTQFVNRYRVHEAQRLLLTDHSVTEAAFACGFESLSYFNRVFRGVTGENPLAFKRRHRSDS
ncbi:MAG: AraC family transcriptional regulator [Gemmatimonadetes bacterium]|nr:MAG: AraC family transcriptional regulator [Gemmatimonadota bacterium]HMC56218.1 AraC family transcriptional regulator [Gemmatimonadaceae bacterium]